MKSTSEKTQRDICTNLDIHAPFQVTDLKQWAYCPRILYYATCLPDVRPITYKMQVGIELGVKEEQREMRRSLRAYGLSHGRREFNVYVTSERLGLRGLTVARAVSGPVSGTGPRVRVGKRAAP